MNKKEIVKQLLPSQNTCPMFTTGRNISCDPQSAFTNKRRPIKRNLVF